MRSFSSPIAFLLPRIGSVLFLDGPFFFVSGRGSSRCVAVLSAVLLFSLRLLSPAFTLVPSLVLPERLRTVLTTQSALSPRAEGLSTPSRLFSLSLLSLPGLIDISPYSSLVSSSSCPHYPCLSSCARASQNIMATLVLSSFESRPLTRRTYIHISDQVYIHRVRSCARHLATSRLSALSSYEFYDIDTIPLVGVTRAHSCR